MNSRIPSRSPTPSPRPVHHSHHGRKVAYAGQDKYSKFPGNETKTQSSNLKDRNASGGPLSIAASIVNCISTVSGVAAYVFPPAQAVSYPASILGATLNLFQKASNKNQYKDNIEKAQSYIGAFGDLCKVASVGIPAVSIGSAIASVANAGLWVYNGGIGKTMANVKQFFGK